MRTLRLVALADSRELPLHDVPPRMRPTFVVDLPVPADEAARRLHYQLGIAEFSEASMGSGRFADLVIDQAERRLGLPSGPSTSKPGTG